MTSPYLPQTVDTLPGRIVWTCATCRQPARAGLIHIDLRAVTQRQGEMKDWEERRSSGARAIELGELFSMPPIVHWQISCDACHRGCSGSCYEIGLKQCQSVYALIKWTAHLYGKSWFSATDWIDFIHRVAQEQGSAAEPTGVW